MSDSAYQEYLDGRRNKQRL